jgi:small-conductance mechanosensitive channel
MSMHPAILSLALGLVTGPKGSDPISLIQSYLAMLGSHPGQIIIRGALSAVVLLLAPISSAWLADKAGRVPQQEVSIANGAHWSARWQLVKERGTLGPWLGQITRLSIWIAALAALVVIWFYGLAIPAQTPRNLGVSVRDLVVRFGGSLVMVALTLALGRILQRGIYQSLEGSRLNQNLALLGGRLIYIAVLLVGLIAILAIWGTGLVLPVTLLGALTVALSLALQDILKNLVAGVYLLLEHPFVIDDRISAASYTGDVEDIQLRVTVLRTEDNQKVLIPNALLFTSAVVNHSAYKRRRAGLSISLPDPGPAGVVVAEERIHAALAAVPALLLDPQPQIALRKSAAGKVELGVNFWLPTGAATAERAIISETIEQVRARLTDADVAPLDPGAS